MCDFFGAVFLLVAPSPILMVAMILAAYVVDLSNNLGCGMMETRVRGDCIAIIAGTDND
jgi:hypothetical protein